MDFGIFWILERIWREARMTRLRILSRVLRIRKIAQFLERQFSPIKISQFAQLPNTFAKTASKPQSSQLVSCFSKASLPNFQLIGHQCCRFTSIFVRGMRTHTQPHMVRRFIFRYLFLF